MPHVERHPTDIVADDLVRTYSRGVSRLQAIIGDALHRGLDPSRVGTEGQVRGDATAAYRDRQLAQARSVLDELRTTGATLGPVAAARSYQAALYAVDTTIAGGGRIAGEFGLIHHRAVTELAGNMTGALTKAADRAGANLEAVFARAAALDGGGRGDVGIGVRLIGRRVNDPWRGLTLDELAGGLVTGETRRQVSQSLVRRLLAEGVTDATTGFVDKAGRRWALDRYAEMAARTTTREAATAATANRMADHGLDLVTISSHPHAADECTPYDGQTFSMSGDTEGYPTLDEEPPFHPNAILGGATIVDALGQPLHGAVRARYDGPAIELKSARGHRLTVSPNHPVLTARGWLPARALRVGDEVLGRTGVDGHRPAVAGVDLDDMPTGAHDVFQALRASGASSRAIPAATDLHGDAAYCQGEVDVIRTHRGLVADLDAQAVEEVRELELVGARAGAAALPSPRPLDHRGGRVRTPVGRSLPDDYAMRGEAAQQGRPGEWATEREFLRARAGKVAPDELVEVRYLNRWRGHAFDLDVGDGTLLAGGIYTHNCLHVMTPAAANLDAYEAALEEEATRLARGEPGRRPRRL